MNYGKSPETIEHILSIEAIFNCVLCTAAFKLMIFFAFPRRKFTGQWKDGKQHGVGVWLSIRRCYRNCRHLHWKIGRLVCIIREFLLVGFTIHVAWRRQPSCFPAPSQGLSYCSWWPAHWWMERGWSLRVRSSHKKSLSSWFFEMLVFFDFGDSVSRIILRACAFAGWTRSLTEFCRIL